MNIIEKISELNVSGFYDPTNGYVILWFYNNKSSKHDIVAYLQNDMTWDVREVDRETSTIYEDREIVEIKHNLLGKYKPGSDFDTVVRKLVSQLFQENEELPDNVTRMIEILKNNSYGHILGNN